MNSCVLHLIYQILNNFKAKNKLLKKLITIAAVISVTFLLLAIPNLDESSAKKDKDSKGKDNKGNKKKTSTGPESNAEKDSGGDGDSPIPVQFSGIGFYKIISTSEPRAIHSELGETSTDPRHKKFGEYFPYSKFSDSADLSNYGDSEMFQKHGQYFFVENFNQKVTTLIGEVNQPIQIQVRLMQPDDPTKIKHLSLYSDINKNRKGVQIIFDKENPVEVIDHGSIFKSVKVNTSVEDQGFWAIFDIVFAKSMPRSDIVLEAWNEDRIISNQYVIDAWEIIEPNNIIEEKSDVSLIAEVEITHDASSPICGKDNSCYTPPEAKILEGGHVIWRNHDSFIHTVTSGISEYGKDDKFDEVLMPGESFQVQFKKSGVYRYYCAVHPWATGIVNVYEEDKPSHIAEIPQRELKVELKQFAGHVSVENHDFISHDKKILMFEVSGNVEDEPGKKRIEITFTKPDGAKQKSVSFANTEGDYFVPLVLHSWEEGNYEINAKVHGEPIGMVSFFLSDERQ